MPAAATSYCEIGDLRIGDIPLPSYMGDGAKYVDGAAEEIDAALGGIYVTPISIDIEANPEQRPAFLLLKKINWLLASGRLVLDLAAPGENADLHAYGRRMLDEGLALLGQVAAREIVLTGAELIPPPPGEEDSPTGPTIHNEDDVSLVESFYTRHNPYTMPVPSLRPPEPYGNVRL